MMKNKATSQLAAQMRDKFKAAEERASSSSDLAGRNMHRAESANYRSLALHLDGLADAAYSIDAKQLRRS